MKRKPDLAILQGLLFTYSTENTKDLEREEVITSKNVNSKAELSELFDILTKPEFLSYKEDEQVWFIETIEHYLSKEEDFESIFYLFDTYFEDEITNKRAFMAVLLERLKSYRNETELHKK
ncbi:hypothetical protein KUA23_13170 [Pseudomonas pergaminensis]|uniref:CdiI immunity protein domain-containing protein n=1 Tax=Pseudomonas pergaminensis TaxID=2853159 RepID=A0ABD7TP74_9PSED|nr:MULTISPECIES: hypothetical protein [Pseudomonas]MBT1262332.1 hypothetical protein [Pseudomonas sp. VS40]MBT1274247.1 hypothetical protein [Pseudomonas sp. VS59]USW03584.1 hypothetical protein KUA23_13170 [Pseudomonas pergaminensis]